MAFVLARPQDAKNVEDACLALRCAGFRDLRIVEPSPEVRSRLATRRSVTICERLAEAITDASLAAGITRRRGQRRKPGVFALEEFAARFLGLGDCGPADHRSGIVAPPAPPCSPVALVFGNESSGLSDEELLECNLAVEIPSSPECPSLNLSHAVALVAYVAAARNAAAQKSAASVSGDTACLSLPDAAALADETIELVRRIGFLTQEGPQGMRSFMKDLYARARFSRFEADRLRELFVAIALQRSADGGSSG